MSYDLALEIIKGGKKDFVYKGSQTPSLPYDPSWSPDIPMSPVPKKIETRSGIDDYGNDFSYKVITFPDDTQFAMTNDGKPFVSDRNLSEDLKTRIRLQLDPKSDGSFKETGIEVDHVISKFLGGTDVESNLQPLRGKLNPWQWLQKKFTPKKFQLDSSTPSKEFEADERQAGKYAVESEAYKKLKSGQITYWEAMAAVQQWDNKNLRNQFLHNEPEPENKWLGEVSEIFNPKKVINSAVGTLALSGIPIPKGNLVTRFLRDKAEKTYKTSMLNGLVKATSPFYGESMEDRLAGLRGASLGVDKYYEDFDLEKDMPGKLATSGISKLLTPIFLGPSSLSFLRLPKEKELKAVGTTSSRFAAEGARFLIGATLEGIALFHKDMGLVETAKQVSFTPRTEKEVMLFGRDEFAAFSNSSDFYGFLNKKTSEILERNGVDATESQKGAFALTIGVGMLLENPFMSISGRTAKEGLEQLAKEALEQELKGELTEAAIKQIARQVPDVVKHSDPVVRKKKFAEMIDGLVDQKNIIKPKSVVSEGLAKDPLLQEAKKYKTADEFIEAQGETVYHGTNAKFDEFSLDYAGKGNGSNYDGIWFTKNKIQAEGIAEGLARTAKITGGTDVSAFVKEVVLELKKPKKINVDDVLLPETANKQIQEAKREGFDSIIYSNIKLGDGSKTTHTVVFNTDAIKTKSQLENIWKEAQPTKVIEPEVKTSVNAIDSFNSYSFANHKPNYYLPPPSGKKVTPGKGAALGETFSVDLGGKSTTRSVAKRRIQAETKQAQKAATELGQILKAPGELKDISNISLGLKDVYRNFRHVFGDKFDTVRKLILEPFNDAKGAFVDTAEKLANELDDVVVTGLGIRKGSKESAAVQRYGEGLITKADLIKRFGKDKTKDIIKADRWFRSKYDELLDEVNESRALIYPNDPSKQIPKRKNYYRHFQEITGDIKGLRNVFETPAAIDPKLAGISEYTKPRSKFLSFAKKRLGGKTTEDAVGGFLNYVPSYSYAVHIDPHIANFRSLGRDLADATVETKNTNNFLRFLDLYANDLAGKTNAADRFVADFLPGGRVTLRALDWANKRVKANVILGNAASSVAQIFNVPQGIGSAKIHSLEGMGNTLAQIWKKGTPIEKSNFIKERYADTFFNRFDTGLLNNTKKFAAWMIGALDEVGTKFIWNSHYTKAIREGIDEPVRYADNITRELVAGRGVGEVPILQKSKVIQMVAPFQLEVQNLWWVLQHMKNKGDVKGIMTTFVALYLMNRAAEQIRGSGVAFDPIDAMIDAGMAYEEAASEGEYGRGLMMAGGRLSGEVLSNVMFGQSFAGAYPEYGFKLNDDERTITRQELFGDQDPTRFGTGPLFLKGLQDPLYSLATPFGGKQIKKTIGGVKVLKEGESMTAFGQKRFDVEATPTNIIKSVLFGAFASNEAREYFESGGKPVSEVTYDANQFLDGMEDLETTEEKRQFVTELTEKGQFNKEVFQRAMEIQKEVDLDLTRIERGLVNASISKRVTKVMDKLGELKTVEERKEYMKRMVEIGVVTKAFFDEDGVTAKIITLFQE